MGGGLPTPEYYKNKPHSRKDFKNTKNSKAINQYLNAKNNNFIDGAFAWLYKLTEAQTVVNEAYQYTSVFGIINNNFFTEKLNVHKTRESLVKQNSDLLLEEISQLDLSQLPFAEANKNKIKYFSDLVVCTRSVDVFFTFAFCYVLADIFDNHKV